MAARERIGAGIARGKLALARRMRTSMSLSHRGAGANTIYFNSLGESIGTVQHGGTLEEGRIWWIEVPVQANFAAASTEAEPVTPGDKATILGREYAVLDPIEKDWTGYIYKLKLFEEKTLNIG